MKTIYMNFILMLLLVFSVSSIAQAEVDGRIMFVTENVYSIHTDINSISRANYLCNSEAEAAGLDGKFIALLSSNDQNIKQVLEANGDSRFYNMRDIAEQYRIVARSIEDLFDGSIERPIEHSANGYAYSMKAVWTGTYRYGANKIGSNYVVNCDSWTDNDENVYGVVGKSGSLDSNWIEYATASTTNKQEATCDLDRRLYCVHESNCGNGIIQVGYDEECDDGTENGRLCSISYGNDCDYCDAECKTQTNVASYCGDGIIQSSREECEGTSVAGETCLGNGYDAGEVVCTSCKLDYSDCHSVSIECGNGIIESGEDCDDDNLVDGDGCSDLCITEYCGDNIVNNIYEECDGTADCEADCTAKPGKCKRINPGEPAYVPGSGCDGSLADPKVTHNYAVCKSYSGCMWEVQICGDGIVSGDEECDKNKQYSVGTRLICDSNCERKCTNIGGDNPMFASEAYGWTDIDTASKYEDYCESESMLKESSCTSDGGLLYKDIYCPSNDMICKDGACVDSCGDGILQTDLGEECDGEEFGGKTCEDFPGKSGEDLICSVSDCTIIAINCLAEGCGDGVVTGDEDCEDGNTANDDGCSASCITEYCGDKIVQVGLNEVCDLGDENTDTPCVADYDRSCEYCNTSCKTQLIIGSYCGDGTITDFEVCDNGTANTDTACVAGYGEVCNYCDDLCDATTVTGPYCGDGTVDVGEDCDDGGNVSGDSCSSTCKLEAKLTLTHKLTDYFGTEISSITNLGNILFNINVSNTVASSAKVYLFNGKETSSSGVTVQYTYPLPSGIFEYDFNCTTDTTSSADFYADPRCEDDLDCPCAILDENFNEGAPLMSVYTAFKEIDLLPKQGDFVKQIGLGQYVFSECIVDGDTSTCPIYVYYIEGDVVLSYAENIIITRDNNGFPRINYSLNDLDNPVGAGILSGEDTVVKFDARNTLYRSLTSSPSSLEYFKDSGSNKFLKYDWYIGVKDTQWGAIVQKNAVPTPQYVCKSTDGSQSCLGVDRICESGDCSVIGAPCSCFGEDIYDGYTTNVRTFGYTFDDDTVCGASKVCAVSLEVTDPNTELVSSVMFSVKLADEEYVIIDATELYGNHSEICTSSSGEEIATTYCCSEGYHVRDSYNQISLTFQAEQEDVCVENANILPTIDISKPEDGSEYVAGTNVYFSALGSDSDGDSVTYLWDFGDRSEPWGKLMLDKDDDIICKANSGSSKCDYDAAYSLDEYDEAEEVPCVCLSKAKYSEDLLNVYQDSASTKAKVTHKYDTIYACTPFDEEQTKDCEVTLWVFDDDDASRTTSIDIELVTSSGGDSDDGSGGSGGSGLYCGDGSVTGDEECDIGEVDACDSGICKSDCSCQPSAGADINVKPLEDDVDEAVCGNNVCEFGENSATCLTDCHCGDDVCQQSLESTKTCPSDCKSSSSWIVLLVIILASVGIIFYLWKEGFDLSKITSLIPKGLPSVGKGSINKNSGLDTSIAPTNPTSKLEAYIQQTRDKGFSYTEIKQELMKKGWKEDKINKAFQKNALP
jgi:cysteine-rich repeat protein